MAGAQEAVGPQEAKGVEPEVAIQTLTQINPRVTRTIITAKVRVRVTKATPGTAVTGAAISRSRPIRVSTIIVRGDITIGSVEEASTIAEVAAEAGEVVKVAGVVGTRIAAAQEEGAASAIRIPPRWKWGTIVNDNGRRAPVRTPARTRHKMATNRGVDTGVAGAGTTGAQAEEEEGEGSEGAGGTTEEIASEGEPPIEEGAPQVHKEETGGDSPVRVG